MNKLFLIPFLSFAIIVNAQETPKSLSLQEAISFALQNKLDAKKAKLKVQNSEYQIQEVRSRALPQIAANGNLTYNPILQTTVIDGENFGAPGTIIQAAFGQKFSSVAGVSFSQNLFDQSVFVGLKAAKSTKEFYQINEQLTQEQLIERVATAYYQVYVTRQKTEVLNNTLQNTQKIKEIIQGLFDNGLAKKIDLDRITVKIANINTTRLQVLNAVELQENALKFYIGMPIDTAILIPDTEFEVTPQPLEDTPDTTTQTEYLLLKKQEQLLEYQKKSLQAGYYPTLSLSGSYNFIGQGPKLPWFAKPSDGIYWSDFASIGLNLRIPIFSGFATKSRINQANNGLQVVKEEIIDTQLALQLSYTNAKKQIENSLNTIEIQKKNAQLAQEVVNNTNNNYKQGLASLTDLLDGENALVEAQNNYTTAILEFKLAEIQLLKSKGELKKLTNK